VRPGMVQVGGVGGRVVVGLGSQGKSEGAGVWVCGHVSAVLFIPHPTHIPTSPTNLACHILPYLHIHLAKPSRGWQGVRFWV
jgi:hypothetical protein